MASAATSDARALRHQLEAFHGKPDSQAEEELQKGTALTRAGSFAEAIPHLLAARGRAANDYGASFNLSLCYVATGQPTPAIPILLALRAAGHDNADVNNLLAQAYVGDGKNQKALETLQKASRLAPESEKLYLFVADACMARQEYAAGLQVVDLGLDHLPGSAHLHYQRGMFLASLDDLDAGKKNFDQAIKLAPESDVAFWAAAQKAMFEGDVAQAVRVARDYPQVIRGIKVRLGRHGSASLGTTALQLAQEAAEIMKKIRAKN
jgi:tetratricopeptide (TPR) repeat protein